MVNKKYYENKILYALNKIDYAKSKLRGNQDRKELSKVYSVLLTFGTEATLKQIKALTKLSRDDIVPILKELKAMGLISWQGKYLSEDKEIKSNKPQFKEWYEDLMIKMKKSDKEVAKEVETAIKTESKEQDWIEVKLEEGLMVKVKKDKLKKALLGM